MNRAPSVTLIVLNWNGRELLADCLAALLDVDYPDFHLIVVDNDSTDGSPAFVRRNFPQVTLVENERNLGFAAGNNVILRKLTTKVAVLVNPDVVVDRDWLRALVAGLMSDEGIGIAGSKLFYPGRERLQHVGGTIASPRAVPRYVGHNEPDRGQYDELPDVDYVAGAAMAIKGDLLHEVGLFDESFFLYYEDVDLCRRAQRARFRVVCIPDAVAMHGESVLAVKDSPTYLHHFHTSRWRYLLKHYPPDEIVSAIGIDEEEWLANSIKQPVAGSAYRHTLRHFDGIMAARQRDGAPPVDDVQQREIVALLGQLQRAAWNKGSLKTLRQHYEIQEYPFRSQVPLLGPAIAAFRDAWSRVAARDYVRPLLAQQRHFNRLLVDRFESRQEELDDHDRRAATLASELSSARKTIHDLRRAAEELEAQLARLEDDLQVAAGDDVGAEEV